MLSLVATIACVVMPVVLVIFGFVSAYVWSREARAAERALVEKRLADIDGRLSALPCGEFSERLARLEERTRRGGRK